MNKGKWIKLDDYYIRRNYITGFWYLEANHALYVNTISCSGEFEYYINDPDMVYYEMLKKEMGIEE